MPKKTPTLVPPAVPSDDPVVLDAAAREAIEKSADALRKREVPIATEPPTVYRA